MIERINTAGSGVIPLGIWLAGVWTHDELLQVGGLIIGVLWVGVAVSKEIRSYKGIKSQ